MQIYIIVNTNVNCQMSREEVLPARQLCTASLALTLCAFFDIVDGRSSLLIAYIAPNTGQTGYAMTAASTTMAAAQIKADGYLNDTEVK